MRLPKMALNDGLTIPRVTAMNLTCRCLGFIKAVLEGRSQVLLSPPRDNVAWVSS